MQKISHSISEKPENTATLAEFQKTLLAIPEGTTRDIFVEAKPGRHLYEIHLGARSTLKFGCVWKMPEDQLNATIIRITLDENAICESMFGIFGESSMELSIENILLGSGSELKETTIFFGTGDQRLTIGSHTSLRARGTSAEIISRGILAERSQGRFDGNIHMTELAKESSAHLAEHTLLLSPECRMNAIPGLTIDTNDVQASHAAGITRVDDEQLFYCGARGIGEKEATRLIAEGYLKNVIEGTPYEKIFHPLLQEKICRL